MPFTMAPSRSTDHENAVATSSPEKPGGTVVQPSSNDTNSANGTTANKRFGRNTSMVESKFLSHPEDLGVVAVGFSGGQVRPPPPSACPSPSKNTAREMAHAPDEEIAH